MAQLPHLLYFWMVAKHGGIAKAGAELRLATNALGSDP